MKNLGPRFAEAATLNYRNLHDDFNNKNTLIFVLSPGADPANTLNNIATSCNKKDKLRFLSLGDGLELAATK